MDRSQTKNSYFLPWYDSGWLSCYMEAKDLVCAKYPNLSKDFEQAFDVFRTSPDFCEQKTSGLISKDVINKFKSLIATLEKDRLEKHELLNFGRFVVHDHPEADQLQESLTNELSDIAGEALEPSYNFLALYNNLGYCQPHMDAPVAKWTLDICIEQSDVWPIFFSDIKSWPERISTWDNRWQRDIIDNPSNQFSKYEMLEGDALFFSGSSQWHYRPRIPQKEKQNFCHLLFLHYIPKGTRELVEPKNWARIFDMPELSHLRYGEDDMPKPSAFL